MYGMESIIQCIQQSDEVELASHISVFFHMCLPFLFVYVVIVECPNIHFKVIFRC